MPNNCSLEGGRVGKTISRVNDYSLSSHKNRSRADLKHDSKQRLNSIFAGSLAPGKKRQVTVFRNVKSGKCGILWTLRRKIARFGTKTFPFLP